MSSRGQRLHPSSPLFDVFSSVRGLVFVGIAALVAAGSRTDVTIALIVAGGALLKAIQYFLTWYRIDATELVVSRGVIVRHERHIPFSRIQNLDLVSGPVHRFFGVAEVRVQTASGAEPEAVLRVLSTKAIEALQAGIGRTGSESAEPAEEPTGAPMVAMTLDDLVACGLVSNRAMVLIGAVLGILWQLGLTDPIEARLKSFEPVLRGAGIGTTAVVAAVFVVVLLVVLPTLSIVMTIVRFHGFTLERIGDEFRIRCGLLTEYASTVVRGRIQLISIRQSPLHRLLKRVSVRVETAGGANEGDQLISRKWFVPMLSQDRAGEILDAVFPGVSLEDVDWRPLAPGARGRMLKKAILIWLAVSVGVVVWFKLWGVGVAIVALPVVVWHTIRTARFMSYARTGRAIVFRSGVWMRATTITLHDRVQIVSVSESPFDRRHGHASLAIDTAGAGPAGRTINIPYLEAERAGGLRRSIVSHVE